MSDGAGNPTTVLYVAGAGRSGSTLLDNLLGQIPGFFSAGELRYVWERGLIDGRQLPGHRGDQVDEVPGVGVVVVHDDDAAAAVSQGPL